MLGLIVAIICGAAPLLLPSPVMAASSIPEIVSYTNSTLSIITLIATAAAVLFLIKGGYSYITSTGKPEILEDAKKTIRNAIIGLVVVLGANVIISIFQQALTGPSGSTSTAAITMTQIQSVNPTGGLTQVLIDAVTGFMQNIVQSSTQPIVDGIMGFLTTTPNVLNNSVIVNFWLVSVGIVDTLFVVVVALLGLQLMSASTLGFEEVELKQLLPRVGLAFLGANISLFLADYVIITSNALVTGVLNATGGLNHAWIVNAINPTSFITGTTPLITLIFLLLFLVIAIVLLLMYISRLIVISLGAVLAPFAFLLWAIPKTADFAEVAVKGYLVSVFTIFIHVVTIQLAASFLSLPENNQNSLLSIAVAIGLFFTLLKIPSFMMQMVLFTSRNGAVRRIGSQLVNVMSSDNSSSATRTQTAGGRVVKVPRKVVNV